MLTEPHIFIQLSELKVSPFYSLKAKHLLL